MKKNTFIFMCLALTTVFNCSQSNNEIIYINNLTNDISKIYNIKKIDIKMLNHNDIKISLTDSRFNNYSSERKQKLANQIGELAIELRDNKPKINTGELIFIDQTNFIIGKSIKSESFNMFK